MSLVWMLLLVSFLVIAHEIGHLVVARYCGVKVERFGLGLPIGGALWSKKIGDIEYCLHPILFGGYVSFPDDSPDSTVPEDSIERFENQPLLNRAAIAMAGITVNAIIAFLMVWGLFWFNGKTVVEPYVGQLIPTVSAVEKVSPDNVPVATTWLKRHTETPATAALPQAKKAPPASNSQLLATRNLLPVFALPPLLDQFPVTWANTQTYPAHTTPQVDFYLQNPQGLYHTTLAPMPAELAGLRPGDRFLSMNHEPIPSYGNPTALISLNIKGSPNTPIHFGVAHPDGTVADVDVTPDAAGRIGIVFDHGVYTHFYQNPFSAAQESIENLSFVVVQNFQGLGMLFTGKLGAEHMTGPIRIVSMGAETIEHSGIESGLMLTALISMILAVMNLLPIPPLDGFYLVLISWEAIFRKPMNKVAQEWMMTVGYFGLMGLMVFVVFNDVVSLIQG